MALSGLVGLASAFVLAGVILGPREETAPHGLDPRGGRQGRPGPQPDDRADTIADTDTDTDGRARSDR